MRDLYEVSTPDLNVMVEIADRMHGCYGARLTGAGFGGCMVNLVDKSAAESFSERLISRYQKQTGLIFEIDNCHASDGAKMIRYRLRHLLCFI